MARPTQALSMAAVLMLDEARQMPLPAGLVLAAQWLALVTIWRAQRGSA